MGITERLARASAGRPWSVVGIWVVGFVVMAAAATQVGDALTTEFSVLNNPDSTVGADLLEERLRGEERALEFVIVQSQGLTVEDVEYQELVTTIVDDVRGLEGTVASAVSYFDTDAPAMVSADGTASLIQVELEGEAKQASDNVGPLVDYVRDLEPGDGFEVLVFGPGSANREVQEITERDLQTGESIGISIALIILLVVFGTLVAALLPLLLAIFAIVGAIGVTALFGQMWSFSFFVVNIITMIGLAVGIDYALFIVQRYREEYAKHEDVVEAIAKAGATASRAVMFSGATVVIALLGLLLIPQNIYRSIAFGSIVVVMFAVLGALTLLPAVLKLLGPKINRLSIPGLRRQPSADDDSGFWASVARGVMGHPVLSLVLAVGLLVALAIPATTIKAGFSGVETMPEDSQARQAFDVLIADFSAGLSAPAEIVIDRIGADQAAVDAGIETLLGQLEADEGFDFADVQTNDAGDLTLVSISLATAADGDAAYEAIRRLRADYVEPDFAGTGASAYVAGRSAEAVDMFDLISTYTPIVFAFVLGLSFLLLMVVFRSIVVPIKAILMNLLSVGATYGVLTLVFQEGVGAGLLGFTQVEAIEAWLPLMLFAILFGLSMDYHVFLLSRIRERYNETGDNTASVAYGVRSTAAVITGAALIMVAVFGGFALGDNVSLQQMGFGLGFAILLDATIIRSVVVPASMTLLGGANWYLPSWLEWLPHLSIEGARDDTTAAVASRGAGAKPLAGGR
ncbi:MAG: MMPL family transporter [Chloroflexi bacterium]|nr:MMPL family transporter [Chloroflexota bacterium]